MKKKQRTPKGIAPLATRQLGSVQHHFLPVREIAGSVVVLGSAPEPTRRSYRCLLEITGVNFALLSAAEQAIMFEGYHRLVASLSYPTQLCVRIQPLDLEAYLQYLSSPATTTATEPEAWRSLAQDLTAFLRKETEEKVLLERRFYLVVGSDEHRVKSRRLRKKRQKQEEALSFAQAETQLSLRCVHMVEQFEGLGLHARLLDQDTLVQLYDEYFGVRRTRYQPLTAEILADAGPGQVQAIEDLLAPDCIRVERDALVINEQEFVCSLVLRALPSEVRPGWLRPLVQLDETMDITIHQWPRDPIAAVDTLRRKQTHYESSVQYAQSKGKLVAPLLTRTTNDIKPLLDSLAAGEERLHDTIVRILVRGTSQEDLERRVARVSEALYAIAHHRPQKLLYEQAQGFQQSLPGARQLSGDALLLPSSAVASLLPFFSNLLYQPTATSVLTGITPSREPIVIDWWQLANYNQFVIAPPGRGKSYKTKLDLLRVFSILKAKAAREGHKGEEPTFQLIAIDPEREYRNVCIELGGQWVQMAPGSSHHLNIFDLPQRNRATQRDEVYIKEDVLANQIQRLHQILDLMLAQRSVENPSASLTMDEKALLDVCLYEIYRRIGVTNDPETHARPAPLLRDLYHVLESGDCGADLTGLASRLRRYVDGSLSGLFSGPTNVELKNSLVVFDLRELDSELRPIVFAMIGTMTWNAAYRSLIPRQLVIDELATVYKYPAGARFVDELFQRARKYYLGITGITQHPELFRQSAIISQCAFKAILGMGQDEAIAAQIQDLFGLTDKEGKIIRHMPIGEGLLLVDGKRMHVRFVASPAEHRLATTNPVELAQWEQERRQQEVWIDRIQHVDQPPKGEEHE